ncbi:MAG: DUF2335 domain-containing protein [Thermoguttaceae bacterium]|nr:DUF2335 domain-containing protein [Thermoguttaceae bacterium]
MSKRKNSKGATPSVRQNDVVTVTPSNDELVLKPSSDPDLNLNVHAGHPAPAYVQHVSSKCYSYPGPPPEVLEAYNRVSPGFAERLLGIVEKEQDINIFERRSNIELEQHAVKEKTVIEKRGQICAVVSIALVCATVVALAYLDAQGIAGIVAAIAGLGALFLSRSALSAKPKKNNEAENNSAARK